MMRNGCFKKGLVIGIIVLFLGVSVIPSTGTLIKKTSSPILGSRGYIQDLIDNASDGDTIYIPSGTYYENIVIDKPISLVGEDKESTIIDGSEIGDVVNVTSDWVNISGFTIRNCSHGFPWIWAGIRINSNHVIINDNIIISNLCDGILIDSASNNTIINNIISKNGNRWNEKYGIHLCDNSYNNIIVGNDIIENGGDGICIENSDNNTITSNTMSANWDAGILLRYSNNNNITDNIFSNHDGLDIGAGISLRDSSNNTIIGNYIYENWYGICLWDSNSNIIISNSFFNSGLLVEDSYHNIIDNNLVNGKPLVYLEDESDVIVTNAGQVVLVNCNYITVENLSLSNASPGLELWRTYNSTIKGNDCSNNVCGILLRYSSYNTIISNNISNTWFGEGIYLSYSSDYNTIIGNIISNNYWGIRLHESYSGLFCDNNIIYHNNFINNLQNAYDDCDNIWDDGKYGNYWSDYEDRYPDAKPRILRPWMWDTPYEIEGGDNKDNCPLIKQWPNLKSRTITRTKSTIYSLLLWFLERFPLLERLINVYLSQ